jgi:threonylcarbamoyladenosine tRNA methylthiotransferase MtaB
MSPVHFSESGSREAEPTGAKHYGVTAAATQFNNHLTHQQPLAIGRHVDDLIGTTLWFVARFTLMRTFAIQTLGCRVNQYESEQIAQLLRDRGLIESASLQDADLRIINTCSVTTEAASKSRQTVRRNTRLNVLNSSHAGATSPGSSNSRVIVTGCWATSNAADAKKLPGVDAVLTHHDDVSAQLNHLLDNWNHTPQPLGDDISIIPTGNPATQPPQLNRLSAATVKKNLPIGTHSLPLLGQHQSNQRAYLKIQDGCDAHCTYCIIPQLRPGLWSKPIADVVDEAKKLVAAGHRELILTGIFLGAFGQPTALRRRQTESSKLAALIDALCTEVPNLVRLRLSSLEPGDFTTNLICSLKSHPQIVPHFHLPLQSGSDKILHRMNRQYTRADFLRMIDNVHSAFDRPAITTDIIVAFPGETDHEFSQTLDVVDRAKFIHIHAFPFSARPGTAAARWTDNFIPGSIAKHRIETLAACGLAHSQKFRESFLNQKVELLVEKQNNFDTFRHGRCERYFDVHFESTTANPGDSVAVQINRITPHRTFGRMVHP